MRTDLLENGRLGEFESTALGVGTARLGAFWQKRGIPEGTAALSQALDLGIGLVDTADVYARGISERIVGRVVRTRPSTVVMTKVGLLKTPLGLASAAFGGEHRPGFTGLRAAGRADTCFTPKYLRAAAHRCLKRQGRDELDVLLLHEPCAAGVRRDDVVRELNRMKQSGMIRAWGASVRDATAAKALVDAPGATWLQIPVNLGDTWILDTVRSHPGRERVTTVGIAVLGDGSLMRRAAASGLDGSRIVAALVEGVHGMDGVDAVLLGMSNPRHVRDNVGAIMRGALEEDIRRLEETL